MTGQAAEAVLLGTPNTEAAFVNQRWGFETPEIIADVEDNAPVVIVDTNNPAELPEQYQSSRYSGRDRSSQAGWRA